MITLNEFLKNIIKCDLPFKVKVDCIVYTFTLRQLSSLLYNFGDYYIEHYSIHYDEIILYLIKIDFTKTVID